MSNMFLIIITPITFYDCTIIWNTTDMTVCKNFSLFWYTHKQSLKKQAFHKREYTCQNSSTMNTFPNLFLA